MKLGEGSETCNIRRGWQSWRSCRNGVPSGTVAEPIHLRKSTSVPAAVCSEQTLGENMFSVLLWIIKQRTELLPQIHFLAFLRELIIRSGGTLKKGRKTAPLKLGSLSAVSRKIQSHTSLHQSSQAWPVIVSNFSLLPLKSKHCPIPSFLLCQH